MHSSRDDSIAERLRRGSFTTDDIDRVALVTDGGAPGQPPTSGVLTVQAAPRGRRPAPRRSSLRLTPSQVMHGSLDSAGTTGNHVELSHAHHSVSTPALRPTVHGVAPPVVASFTRGGFAPTLPPPVAPLPPQGPTAVVTIPAAARPLSTSLGSVPRRPPPKRKTLAPSSTALGSFGASPSVGDTILGIIQHLEQAMHLSDGTVSRMATYITPVAKQHASRKMLAPRELSLLQELRRDINSFLLIQEHSASVVLLQAYVRRWIAIKRFKFKKQNFVRQRNEAFTELMRNETEYVLNLATIVDRYLIPLQSTRKHVYDKVKNEVGVDPRAIFSNAEDLLSVHRFVLNQFEVASQNWPIISGLGILFMKLTPRFNVYGQYVNNFKIAMDTLVACESCAQFREFLECQQRQDLDLQMRLTLPLNHIAMYERLLRRITEHTSHEDPDLQCLMGALTIMEETANFIRNSLAQADNRASLMRIQRSLYVPPGVRMQNLLSTTHRNFVKELHLEFQRPPGSSAAAPPAASSSTPRSSGSASPLASGHVFLFSDIVVLTRSLAHAATTKATPATQANISTALYQVEWQYSLDRTIIAEVSSTSFSIAETSESGSEVPESTYHLVFAQAPKAHEWYSTLRESIEHNQPNRVFGVDLKPLIQRESQLDHSGIPMVLRTLIEYLEFDNGLDTVGLFRIPGTASTMTKLRSEFNQQGGDGVNLKLKQAKVHDIAGLLKMFFRDLPECLCTYDLVDAFIATQTQFTREQEAEMVADLKRLIQKLPYENRHVMHFLIQFLHRVIQHRDQNKMDSSNLAVCFGPNIIRPREQTIEYTLNIPKANSAFQCMVDHADELFTS